MSYLLPNGDAVNLSWAGTAAYTAPTGDVVNFNFSTSAPDIDISVVATIAVAAAMSLDHVSIEIGVAITASVPVTAAADVAHGVSLVSVATVPVIADIGADHGVVVAAAAVVQVTPMQNTVHGVALDGAAVIGITADADIEVERYELRGEVRLGGLLVDRRVRAYQRTSGELVGEADTVVGRFSIHTGFVSAEHYLTPIDLTAGAVDWSPPTANRVTSLLALDTA